MHIYMKMVTLFNVLSLLHALCFLDPHNALYSMFLAIDGVSLF